MSTAERRRLTPPSGTEQSDAASTIRSEGDKERTTSSPHDSSSMRRPKINNNNHSSNDNNSLSTVGEVRDYIREGPLMSPVSSCWTCWLKRHKTYFVKLRHLFASNAAIQVCVWLFFTLSLIFQATYHHGASSTARYRFVKCRVEVVFESTVKLSRIFLVSDLINNILLYSNRIYSTNSATRH